MTAKHHWIRFACALALAAVTIEPMGSTSTKSHELRTGHFLCAVNQAAARCGSVSVYDISARHRLVKTMETVRDVGDVRGIAASAVSGRLYVTYRTHSGIGMIYCLNVYDDVVLWNRAIDPGVDRLAVHPGGQFLYVPTWEGGSANFINVLDASTGDVVRKVYFSNRSHDTLFPLSGPLFRLWGMQVAELKSGRIVTANLAEHPPGEPGLPHGISWTPDEREVWQSSSAGDPHIYVWGMRDPMAPVPLERISMKSPRGAHWLTFNIEGNYAYVAPNKSSDDATEIFDAHRHKFVGLIGSSEDMIEIDFTDGKVSHVGDQYGVGRVVRTSTN